MASVEQLTEDSAAITFDVPGAGESPTPRHPYVMPMLAALTARMVKQLGYGKVDVFGLSWGGALAQQFAIQYPMRCRRLVLAAPVLEDGDHPAYITKVDGANDRIVVDVVQVFNDDEAVKAAIADGESPAEAKYLTGWVRNENPRLRTLPLAGGLDVRLLGGCEESGSDRAAVLSKLADHAKRKGPYYFTLTVADGKVKRIQEHLAINAC